MDPTPTLLEAFKEEPRYMLLSIALGAFAFAVAFGALASRGRGIRISVGSAAMLVALLALGGGAFGMLRGRSYADTAAEMPGLSGQDRERVKARGYAQALYPLETGIVSAVPGLALGLLGLALGLRKK